VRQNDRHFLENAQERNVRKTPIFVCEREWLKDRLPIGGLARNNMSSDLARYLF
jgi:hypothetical protein